MFANRAARRAFFTALRSQTTSNKRNLRSASSIAAATVIAALAVQQQQQQQQHQQQQQQQQELKDDFEHDLFPLPSSLITSTMNTTACDYAFLSSGGGGGASSSSSSTSDTNHNNSHRKLRRQHTVALIQTTAVQDSVDSKYKVEWRKPVGLGTFGGVYRAVHRTTGKPVAVKKIPKQCTEFASFQREMESLIHIADSGGHPYINTLRETFIGENGDENYYLILDLIQGGEMFDELCEKGAYSEADAARIIRQVASALAFLHGIGVVHSDLKPENIMLSTKNSNNATIQLVDFGCAHKLQNDNNNNNEQDDKDDPSRRETASTPAYCPPEVLKAYKNKQVHIEPSFDMWSLGVIMYVMLTGMHPFDMEGGASMDKIEARVIEGKVPPLDQFKHISQDAKSLIEGLLDMDPNKRLTASQLLGHPWVRGETASSRKIPHSHDKLQTYHRHKTSVGKHIFLTMLKQSSMAAVAAGASDDSSRTNMCLLESAFRQLDQNNLGYISTKALHGDTRWFAADAQLTLSELSDVMSESMANRYLPKGHVLYKEGEKGDSMFFLNAGTVEVASAEGFVKERGSGEFFGEDALTGKDGTYSNTVVCKTPVHAIEISRDYVEKYMNADKEVALTMAETDRLRNRERAKSILGLQKNMRHNDYKKGDIIFEQGGKGSILYIVEDGKVDIFRDGHKVRTLHKGEMTGEHAAFYDHKPYTVTAKCMGDTCKMGILKGEDMHALFKQNPSLQSSFREIVLRRDFKKAVCAATDRPFPETEEDLRAAFNDMDTDKDGALALSHLRRIMLDFDPGYTEEDIQDLLTSMDLSKTGSLSWTEFKLVFGMAEAY